MKGTNYSQLIINSVVTALAVAAVNAMFLNRGKKGMGTARMIFANLPLDRQARMADMRTVVNVNNKKWIETELSKVENNADYSKMASQKDIANLAFVALHTKYPLIKNRCMIILNNLKKHVA